MSRVSKADALRIGAKVIPVKADFNAVRAVLKQEGIAPETQIKQEAWAIFLKFAMWSYDPKDYGRFCKHAEVVKRIKLKAQDGISWTTYSEFFAHNTDEADFRRNGVRIEHKGGCGDFNHCQYKTIQQMRREYERKDELLEWDYASAKIYVICTWAEFFQYLEGYGKGLDTWYRQIRPTTKGYAFVLQSIKNSKPKLAYLQAWSLNQYKD